MAHELLEKEIEGMSEEMLMQLVDYAEFLNYTIKKETIDADSKPKRKIGVLASEFLSISDDFDDCLDGWEDYGVTEPRTITKICTSCIWENC